MTEQPSLLASDELPLVARTELLDVRLVAFEGRSQDRSVSPGGDIRVAMENMEYRAEPDRLLVRLTTEVFYYEPGDIRSEPRSPETPDDRNEVGKLSITHLAELSLTGDPSSISQQDAEEFLGGTMLFSMFPYVREAVHRYSMDLRFPPTILPFLRRPLVAPMAQGPNDDPPTSEDRPSQSSEKPEASPKPREVESAQPIGRT